MTEDLKGIAQRLKEEGYTVAGFALDGFTQDMTEQGIVPEKLTSSTKAENSATTVFSANSEQTPQEQLARKHETDQQSTETVEETSDFSEFKRQIGNGIRTIRKESGMTQRELAKRAGSAQPTINNIENGYANPTIGTLDKIAQGFGRRLHVSLGGKTSGAIARYNPTKRTN